MKQYVVIFVKDGKRIMASGTLSWHAAEITLAAWKHYWEDAVISSDRAIADTVEILEYWGGD